MAMFDHAPSSPSVKNTLHHERTNLLAWHYKWYTINPLLTLFGVVMILTFIGTVIGIAVDHRVITGMPAWAKPAKFAISFAVYTFSFLWLLTFIQGHKRLKRITANVIAITAVIEMVIIITQVVRGTTSHFNVSTPLNTILFAIMGVSVVIFALMNVIVAIPLLFQRLPNPAFAWSLRLGLLVFIVGLSVGFLMLLPTPAQLAAMQTTMHTATLGAHSVGVADGGPGLPFLGWSTTGGDLRIPHFVGMHALQVLPLFGWLIARQRSSKLRNEHRVALVSTLAIFQ